MHTESASTAARPRSRRRASVGLHLVVAFSLCLLTVAAVMALATASSFRGERTKARLELRSAAQAAAEDAAQSAPALIKTLQGVATQPGVSGLDPVECQNVLGLFSTAAKTGRVDLFGADGSILCALPQPDLPTDQVAKGPWFGQVLETRQPVNAGTAAISGWARPCSWRWPGSV